MSDTALVTLENATRMLAEARTFTEVKKIRDVAVAAQAYARAHDLGEDARRQAGKVIAEADIRGGKLLKQMADAGERAALGKPKRSEVERLATLADLGITRKQASDAQAIAGEEDAVRAWMDTAKEVTPRRAARVARDATAKRKRDESPPPILPVTCDLRFGDFREVLADVPDGSVDVVLTDPPYPKEFLPLWSDLAEFAKRVLKPDGMLVAMSGQTHLPEVMVRLGEHLTYRWVIAFMMPGAANVVHARKVSTMWKPVLVYGSSDRRLTDVALSDRPGASKDYHEWGQSEYGMADLLKLVAEPGATICDPFVGGGTTALVALEAGCSFVGAEIDADAYATAAERIANV